ncbi:MAG: DUF2829 domain-containing protein [Muribaculum sp.]|nr:DUF2829 domain-containing protein [Muribaculum sp.]
MNLEQAAQEFAKRVVKSNPEARGAEGLIHTAVIYGAQNIDELSEEMSFGQAIAALKMGRKVSRKGWNGKGMFLWLKPAATVKAEWCKDPLLKSLAEKNGGEIDALGTICMYTAHGAILSGWLASQTDMLSEDWEVVAE